MALWQLKPVTSCRCCVKVWFHEPHIPLVVTDDFIQLYKGRPDFKSDSMQIKYVMTMLCAHRLAGYWCFITWFCAHFTAVCV